MKSSPKYRREFVFGSYVYHYDLVKQDRRSLSLSVNPQLEICLKCPSDVGDERIEAFLKRKWFWLEKQLCYFRKYQRKVYKKEYVSGEGFLYLGRQYKLVVKRAKEDKVSLTKGLLMVYTTSSVRNGKRNKKLLEAWYEERTEEVFAARFNEMKKRFDYKKMPDLVTREMSKRWGSYLQNGRVVLNPKLIHTPKNCIDYVIVHELCHVKYRNHNKYFFTFLDNKYPGWEKVKDKLEVIGIETG
jgi:predicted metal-dependent hydrolase